MVKHVAPTLGALVGLRSALRLRSRQQLNQTLHNINLRDGLVQEPHQLGLRLKQQDGNLMIQQSGLRYLGHGDASCFRCLCQAKVKHLAIQQPKQLGELACQLSSILPAAVATYRLACLEMRPTQSLALEACRHYQSLALQQDQFGRLAARLNLAMMNQQLKQRGRAASI